MQKFDITIIGGGAGGLNIVSAAAQLGLKVCLVEKQAKLGGDCLHFGCVPSKTLIHTAKVAHLMRNGAAYGLRNVDLKVDMAEVNAHVLRVVEHIQHHDAPKRFEDYGCTVVFGAAEFIAKDKIKINDQVICSKRFVVATGSKPAVPNIPGLQENKYLTNETIYDLKTLPKHLIILGGGVVGVEFAQVFARLGSRVTLLEAGDRILPQQDQELALDLQKILSDEGVEFKFNVRVNAISKYEDIYKVSFLGADKNIYKIVGDGLLVAVGRNPNVTDLNLDAAGVKYDAKGIAVDSRMRTSNKKIFAVGDCVASKYKFTHVAEYQAGIIVANAVFRWPKHADFRVVPIVIFSDPEFAHVGMTEAEAKAAGIGHEVVYFDFKDVDRALTEANPYGSVKLLVRRGKVLGASILGKNAGELIAEVALAMQVGAKLRDITATIHAYPTLAQATRRVVNQYFYPRLFNDKVKMLVRWINR